MIGKNEHLKKTHSAQETGIWCNNDLISNKTLNTSHSSKLRYLPLIFLSKSVQHFPFFSNIVKYKTGISTYFSSVTLEEVKHQEYTRIYYQSFVRK